MGVLDAKIHHPQQCKDLYGVHVQRKFLNKSLNCDQNQGFCPEPGLGATLRVLAVRKAAECNGQIPNWMDFC